VEAVEEKVKDVMPLKGSKCFYFASVGADGRGSQLVFEVIPGDKYAPRKTGVHNVEIA